MSSRIALDGIWTLTLDPQGRGEREGWYERSSGFGRPAALPAAWSELGQDLAESHGAIWVHRPVELPSATGPAAFRLAGEGAWYELSAWLNGQALGTHRGSGPFAFDASAAALPGQTNHLVLRLADPADASELPLLAAAPRRSGLWLPMAIEQRPLAHISGHALGVALDPDRVEARLHLSGPVEGKELRVVVKGADGKELGRAQAQAKPGAQHLSVRLEGAKRWHPEDPHLLTVRMELGAEGEEGDHLEALVGLRSVAFAEGKLRLNGQVYPLRAMRMPGVWPGGGRPTVEEAARAIRLAKECGTTALVMQGPPGDPRFMDAADRLGMLLWVELPGTRVATPRARTRLREECRQRIARDGHRPSIVGWAVGPDPSVPDAAEPSFWTTLAQELAELDVTRPIGVVSSASEALRACWASPWPEAAELAPEAKPEANRLVALGGTWGLPDPPLAWDEEAARRFERLKLAVVFDDAANLARLTQKRQVRSLKGQIEAYRAGGGEGYVAGSLVDMHGAHEGALDASLRPKAGFEEWSAFHGPIAAFALPEVRNAWCGEPFVARLVVANQAKHPIEGVLRWGIDGADADAEVEVHVPAGETRVVGRIAIEAPPFPRPTATRLMLKLEAGGWEVARNACELTFTPVSASRVDRRSLIDAGLPTDLARRLQDRGFSLHPLEEAPKGSIALATAWGRELDAALDAGHDAVLLAEEGPGPGGGELSFRRLPRLAEERVGGPVQVLQWDRFPQIPLGLMPGWELAGLFPRWAIPLGNYPTAGGEARSNQAHVDPADVLAATFEGRLERFAATMLRMNARRGRLIATTLRLAEGYGRHPIGTLLLNRLLTDAALFEPTLAYELES